jgi:Ca2+-binding EF-hand superfamily protein
MADAGKKKKSKKADEEGGSKKKAQRSGSNVFAMFTQNQVQTFKEAFQMIDQDKDGFISKNDIRQTFDSLGRLCTEDELNSMVAEAPGPINFTMFLTIFGDRAQGTDDEQVILNAFAQYDEGDGTCKDEVLRVAMTTWGEKFTLDEWESMVSEAPMVGEKIDIKKWAKVITGTAEDDS